jgi:uncharacterized protein DUF1308
VIKAREEADDRQEERATHADRHPGRPGGGGDEFAGARAVAANVQIVPDMSSARVFNLTDTQGINATDRRIFGTADQLGLQIITGDQRFVNSAAAQGVIFMPTPIVLTPAPRFFGH